MSVYISFTHPKPAKNEGNMEYKSSTIKIHTLNVRKYFNEEFVYISIIGVSHCSLQLLYYFNNEKPLNFQSAPKTLIQVKKEPKYI